MKNKKRSLLLTILALLSTLLILNSVLAVWIFTLSSSAIYEISSTDPGDSGSFNITKHWSGSPINTDDGPGSFKDKFQIENLQEPIDVIFNIDENITDVIDDCFDYADDCDIWYEVSSDASGYKGIIADADVFTLDSKMNYVWAVINCKRFSCPQNIEIETMIIPA